MTAPTNVEPTTKPRIAEGVLKAVLVALVPVAGYSIAYAYQYGYASHFSIPSDYISLDTTSVISTTALVVVPLFIVGANTLNFAAFIKPNWLLRLFPWAVPIAYIVVFVPILGLSGSPLVAYAIYLLPILTVYSVFLIVIPLVKKPKLGDVVNVLRTAGLHLEGVPDQLSAEASETPLDTLTPTQRVALAGLKETLATPRPSVAGTLFESIGIRVMGSICMIAYVIALAIVFGDHSARTQAYFYVDKRGIQGLSELVVIRHYGNELLLSPLRSDRHSVCQAIVVLPADTQGLVLYRTKLGRLTSVNKAC